MHQQLALPRQVLAPHRAAVGQRVVAGHEHALAHAADVALVEAGAHRAAVEMKGHAGALLLDVVGHLGRGAVEQRELEARKLHRQLAHQRADGGVRQGFVQRQRQRGLVAFVQRAGALVELLGLPQQLARLEQQHPPRVGQLRVAARAVEQRHAEVDLEQPDGGAHGRLGLAQVARRGRERAALGGRHELAQLVNGPFHSGHPSIFQIDSIFIHSFQ
ncbi:hypothetical protein D9M68_657400 [compost metagenome]